jgi:hypothetical protein
MKPLNLDNSPCSPVSSNCVIWQGPNIDCISLCTGDSISTVIYNLATELCTIMNQLDLSNLDLTCLQVGNNPPDTFSELIQLLINKICNAGTGTPGPAAITDPCPTNCIVPIADCFKTSATQTTMLLLDYVQMIGEKVCSLVDQIGTINTTITNIDNRVTELENTPPPVPYVLPSFTVDCTLSSTVSENTSHNLRDILEALVNDDTNGYCALLFSLGRPGNVTNAYLFQSITVGNYIGTTGASASLFNCGTAMQSEYSSWTATPLNLSDSFKNLWITVSDIRKAHKTYEVKNVTGDTSVNITTTTANTACGNKDTVTVSANLPIVAAGDNITVTPNTVANVTTYTVNGKETIVQQGANITVTQTGPTAGDTTYTVAGKGLTVTDSNSIDLTLTTVGTDWNIKARIVDTGWQDLEGFSWFQFASVKPQCRRIGNVVYFRGSLMIPLANTPNTAVVPYNYSGNTPYVDTYGSLTDILPWQGAEGVNLSTGTSGLFSGALQFNNNTRVVPLSVVGNGENFEHSIFTSWVIGSRFFRSKIPSPANSRQPYSSMIHMLARIYITTDKKIGLQMLRDLEENASSGVSTNGSSSFATSMLNILAPPVKVNENIPYFRRAPDPADDITLGSSPNIDIQNMLMRYSYSSNDEDVNDIGVYPFSCDPNNPSQVGGFGWMSLDGMMAYLAPCNTDLKGNPCP